MSIVKDLWLGKDLDPGADSEATPVPVEVVIEIPRGSFLKRGSCGTLDFVSPLPCPFNYGSVPRYIGGEGDLLDAIVLGPRLAAGTRVQIKAWAAIGLAERYMYDDKLVCSSRRLTLSQCRQVFYFMHFYALCKGVLNRVRGRAGPSYCTGWQSVGDAMERALPAPDSWRGSPIDF